MSGLLQGLFGGSSSSSSSNFTSNPMNMQNPSYTGLAPNVASALSTLFSGGPAFSGPGSAVSPNVGGTTPGVGNVQGNPLVAPLTAGQTTLSNQAGAQAAPTPQQGQANDMLSQILNGNFLNVGQNPVVQGAVQAAVNPIKFAYANQAVPANIGQFTGAGQSTASSGQFVPGQEAGNAPNAGSSAFDKAAAIQQAGEANAIAGATSNIESNAYAQALNQIPGAIGAAATIPGQLINNTVNALQAVSLPQLIEQYGINQGLQVFQQRIQTMLTALGLGGQVSQPVVAAKSGGASRGTGSSSGDTVSGVGNLLSGIAMLNKSNPFATGGILNFG